MTHTMEDVQRQLKAKGFDPGPLDGKRGPLTQAAIKRFQKSHNLAETGAVNAFTEAALFESPAKPTSLIGGLFASIFSKETGMSKYSKLIGTIIGSGVGMALSYLASRGLATCATVDGTETCSMWGMSQAQITGFLVMVIGSFGTWVSPPNSPLGGK